MKSPKINLKILYLVSTPIGNRDDISIRALKILKEVPTIIVEEYKTGKKNLEQLGIDLTNKKIIELNEHVEKTPKLYTRSHSNHNFFPPSNSTFQTVLVEVLSSPKAALISDGGSPVIADPGFPLLQQLSKRKIPFTHVAGSSSLISGLLLSGFALSSFYYAGFLPQNHTAREQTLKKLLKIKELLVIMETPYRLKFLLDSLKKLFPGNTPVSITFDLSSSSEEIFHGTVTEAYTTFFKKGKNRRPFVLFINNRYFYK